MDIQELQTQIDKCLITSEQLLGTAKVLDSSTRLTPLFADPKYFPVYYYLGKQLKPKRVVQIGPTLGLVGACFLQGNKTTELWHVKLAKDNPCIKIVASNLRQHFSGTIQASFIDAGDTGGYDLAIISEKCEPEKLFEHLCYLWEMLEGEGLLVTDYINGDAVKASYEKFYRVKNREPMFLQTRYGISILTR